MSTEAKQLEMAEAGLLGHRPEEVACNQCGGAFCGHRVGRVFEDRPLIMCGRKNETREVLAALKRRQ